MEFYNTKFEAKPKKSEYKVELQNVPPYKIYQKAAKENRNLDMYMSNLHFMKEQAKLFNYVDRTKKFLPEDDDFFRF